MPLRTPVLDDRSYAQLRDELVARIPVYAPEWTDHHPSDPGITLIELFAFLGENLLYRFNQIPDATKLAFLDLLAHPAAARRARRPARCGSRRRRRAARSCRRRRGCSPGRVPFQTLRRDVGVAGRRAGRDPEGRSRPTATRTSTSPGRAAALGASRDAVSTYQTSFGAHEPLKPGGDVLDPAGVHRRHAVRRAGRARAGHRPDRDGRRAR